MNDKHRSVLYFCADRSIDPVAHAVFDAVVALRPAAPTGREVDGLPVLTVLSGDGAEHVLVRTRDVVSHDYARYLPTMNALFAEGYDFGAVVNWHEGANAPARILCAHTTGDVPSGTFAQASPRWLTSLLIAMEARRVEAGLDGYTTTSEATHWSGIPHGGDPVLAAAYPVPLVDVEIGSEPESWGDAVAARALAAALLDVFQDGGSRPSILGVGGVHFEPVFAAAVLTGEVALSHLLPNHWVADQDDATLSRTIRAAVASVQGGVDEIVFHDSLKGTAKGVVRAVAEDLGVPATKHQAFRRRLLEPVQ